MDSSGLQSSASISSNCENEKDASELIQSKRAKFFSRYQRQNFSLPDSIMFYIAQNPISPSFCEKMIQTCKYFFVKNPILVISSLYYFGDGKWELSLVQRPIDLSKISSKLWIPDELYVRPEISVINEAATQNILSSLMPKLYKCDAKFLSIIAQIISFHDLSLLISSAEEIDFYDLVVKDENGSNVALEKIFEVAVKAKEIKFGSDTTLSNITSETMKELIKLPHFSNLHKLKMTGIPEAFDLETFYIYMKKNKVTEIWLAFDYSISETYNNRLEEIVDEILATETRDYKAPTIRFNGLVA